MLVYVLRTYLIFSLSDETDYTPTARFDTVLTFNDDTRRGCGNIMITDDLVYENQERFSLRLGDLGGSLGLPRNLVMSPDASEIIILDNESENNIIIVLTFS